MTPDDGSTPPGPVGTGSRTTTRGLLGAAALTGFILIEQAAGDRVPFLHWMAIGIPMVAILLPVAAWEPRRTRH